MIHCPKCGTVPLKESDLPLELPKLDEYKINNDALSPLASIDSWVNVKCPICGEKAKREINTMPQWAGSC
ncbi:MAG: hypothetical protein PHO23_01375 [Candidatus Pacebacteria bacterium]|nr:hypothetical protein [Candidatus Paceibacterota bacterium]